MNRSFCRIEPVHPCAKYVSSFLSTHSVNGNMAEMEGSTSVGEEVSADMAIASPSVSDSCGSDNSEKSEEELFEVERIVGLSKIRVSASAFPLCEMQCMYTKRNRCPWQCVRTYIHI